MSAAAVTRELYVYWKTGEPAQAADAVRLAQSKLCREVAGLQARVLRREPGANGLATLMEVYRHPTGIDPALQARIDETVALATQRHAAGARHSEVFVGT